jgi:alpha-galactosidase
MYGPAFPASAVPVEVPAPTSSGESIVEGSRIRLTLSSIPHAYYRHGWQSWSLASWQPVSSRIPVPRPAILRPLQTDPANARRATPHGSWVGAVRFENDTVVLLGALGLDAHVELRDGRLDGWSEREIVWLVACGTEESVFSAYARQLGELLGRSPTGPASDVDDRRHAPRLWCSWYSFYRRIDESTIRRMLREASDLPFDTFQIDDGWQRAVGDWEPNAGFPSGMESLARDIRSTDMRAGLWLAPFIATDSSRLVREHPDWFVRDDRGQLISAGFNWDARLRALDTTHPGALRWLADMMRRVRAWGYEFLKLDFLYAAALPGRRRVPMPREEAYRLGLETVRQAIGPDAYVLACGAPIVPSIGLCDALRIGPDVGPQWQSCRDAILLANPATPGVRNAIRTTLHRLWLAPLVRLDPDVAYVRSTGCSLSDRQRELLRDLALICDYRGTSDPPEWLGPSERGTLVEFLTASPSIRRVGRYRFLIGDRAVDFSDAVDLPRPPRGLEAILGGIVGWLGNRPLVLRLLNAIEQRRLARRLLGYRGAVRGVDR